VLGNFDDDIVVKSGDFVEVDKFGFSDSREGM